MPPSTAPAIALVVRHGLGDEADLGLGEAHVHQERSEQLEREGIANLEQHDQRDERDSAGRAEQLPQRLDAPTRAGRRRRLLVLRLRREPGRDGERQP